MIQIRNNQLVALINPLGAELTELSKNDGVNVLWKKDSSFWNRISPNLFPIVGRLKSDSYTYENRNFSMSQHGFVRDFYFEVINQDESSVIFELNSNEVTKQQYPFDFTFQVCYSIENSKLKVKFNVQNRGGEVLPYSVGGHPGFAVNGSINDYYLVFEGNYKSERWLLEGPYYSGKTEPILLNEFFELDYKLFENDAIVIRNPKFGKVMLAHKKQGKLLSVSSNNWHAIGFWSKQNAPFFCIEPWWGWADSINSSGKFIEKEGLNFLNANEIGSHSFEIELF
jgi:galactose mutarotase-like enzyme